VKAFSLKSAIITFFVIMALDAALRVVSDFTYTSQFVVVLWWMFNLPPILLALLIYLLGYEPLFGMRLLSIIFSVLFWAAFAGLFFRRR